MSAPDVTTAVLSALLGSATITDSLSDYRGTYPIFTRRPVPDDAPSLVGVLSPDIAVEDEDGVNDYRPVVERDLAFYGQNKPNDASEYRAVEALARAARTLFHNKRTAITVTGWDVVNVQVTGPRIAPVDNEQTVGRIITLRIQLAKLAS